MAYFPVSFGKLQRIALSRRFEDVAGYLVLSRFANGKPVLEYKPHRHSGAGVNALHEKLRISEETARGILMRLQEGGFLKEAQPDLKAVDKKARWDLMPEEADLFLPHVFVDGMLQCSSPILRLKEPNNKKDATKLQDLSVSEQRLDCLMLLLAIYKGTSMKSFGGLDPSYASRSWNIETTVPSALLTRWGTTPMDPFFDLRFVEGCLAHCKDLAKERESNFCRFFEAWLLLKSFGLIYEAVTLFSGTSKRSPGNLIYTIRINDFFAATNEANGDPSVMGSLEDAYGTKLAFYMQPDEFLENEALRVLLPDSEGMFIGIWRPRFRPKTSNSGQWFAKDKDAVASAVLKISQLTVSESFT